MSGDEKRYVVWMPGEQPEWELPAASDGVCTGGGHRVLHELAVAIASTGRPVEVRGEFDFAELKGLGEGAGASPELAREARTPGTGDVILMPEGFDDPLTFGFVALSGARLILLLLAPSGLFGWPFVRRWSRPSPLNVPVEWVGQPEHFKAMAAMGFELWSNSPVLVDRIRAAGVSGTFIGAGRSVPFPTPLTKRYDVVTLANNRWSDSARVVVSQLDRSVVHHEIGAVSNAEVLEQFGQARLLIHPLRIEGDSRIGQEARAMGVVPVVLNSNPFSVGLDEDGGALAVSSLEEMPAAVTQLLAHPGRLESLRERGMRSARAELDWDRFVERVDGALRLPRAEDSAREARELIGEAIQKRERQTLDRLRTEIGQLKRAKSAVEDERDALVTELDQAKDTIRIMRNTRVWRLAGWFWKTRDRVRDRLTSARRAS